ncbi:hypothetical protein [Mucilaginibacter corticis]|uniref:hypothetical protein n=1 Tax=Mucilaginibacter corticis TaxID=2597670 RepID=UPI0016435BE6|nr:hypothetical protein [Mucilaginibacter corticis]
MMTAIVNSIKGCYSRIVVLVFCTICLVCCKKEKVLKDTQEIRNEITAKKKAV